MDKIIGVVNPFDLYQKFYVYQNSECINSFQTELDKIPEAMLLVSKQYGINQINFAGPQDFVQGIIHKVSKAELEKYSTNNLILTCI